MHTHTHTHMVVRHANLPYYGESFHDNEFKQARRAADIQGIDPQKVSGYVDLVTRCYCEELGRPPDAGGMANYVKLLHQGRKDHLGVRHVTTEAWIREGMASSGEGRVCVCIYTYFTDLCIHTYIDVYGRVCMYIYILTDVCIHTYMYVYIQTYVNIHTYV